MVKFINYLNKCLQNDEFRKYWEAENLTIDENEENMSFVGGCRHYGSVCSICPEIWEWGYRQVRGGRR